MYPVIVTKRKNSLVSQIFCVRLLTAPVVELFRCQTLHVEIWVQRRVTGLL